MIEQVPRIQDDDARAVAALSEKLNLPEREVVEIYRIEFDRLAEQARIPNFLSVLAMRNTKSILKTARTVAQLDLAAFAFAFTASIWAFALSLHAF
jgi:hypothetical protein